MNIIKAELDKSDYDIYDDFININIDGAFLDEILNTAYPDSMYKGLIPTMSFAMEIEAESKIVWQRILPDLNNTSVCPILMCPDDCDFSCTIIVAEIESLKDTIRWNRIGVDITKDCQAEKIGSTVEWFEELPIYEFSRTNYSSMIEVFQIQFEIDKANYNSKQVQ